MRSQCASAASTLLRLDSYSLLCGRAQRVPHTNLARSAQTSFTVYYIGREGRRRRRGGRKKEKKEIARREARTMDRCRASAARPAPTGERVEEERGEERGGERRRGEKRREEERGGEGRRGEERGERERNCAP